MRCREVRNRADQGIEMTKECLDHLKTCELCRQYVSAAGSLDKLIEAAREQSLPPSSELSQLRDKIENQFADHRKGISIMSRIKHQVGSHPKLSFSVAVAAGVLAILLLVPFSYNQTVGYSVSLENQEPLTIADQARFDAAMETLGLSQAAVSVRQSGENTNYQISNLPDHKSAREVAATFGAITGIDPVYRIEPIVKLTSGTLYAQAMDKLNRIQIDAKGKTDAEIKADIEQKLRDNGLSNPQVNVTTKSDGTRQIQVGITDSSDTKMMQKQIELNVAGDDISFESTPQISIDTKNKTDQEIKDEITDKLREQGVDNPSVKITTEPDGKRKIEIEAEKKDGCCP